MEYFFIFWFFAFFLCITVGDKAARKYILPLFLAALSLYFGFRDGYGTDYMNYIGMVEVLKYQPDLDYVGGEIGFRTLILLFNNLGLPSNTIIVFSFIISIACLSFAAYRLSPNVTLSFIVILGFGFLFASFNIVRQALAFSIICALLVLIRNEKYVKFSIGVIVVGIFFHKTAVLLAVLPLFRFVSFSAKTWAMLLFTSLILMQVNNQLFDILASFLVVDWFAYAHYFDSEWAVVSRNDTYLNLAVRLMISLWLITRVEWFNQSTFNRIIFNGYMVGFCVQVIFIDIQSFNRVASVFTWFSFLVIPMAIMSYSRKNNRILTSSGLIAYTLLISYLKIGSYLDNFDVDNHLFSFEQATSF